MKKGTAKQKAVKGLAVLNSVLLGVTPAVGSMVQVSAASATEVAKAEKNEASENISFLDKLKEEIKKPGGIVAAAEALGLATLSIVLYRNHKANSESAQAKKIEDFASKEKNYIKELNEKNDSISDLQGKLTESQQTASNLKSAKMITESQMQCANVKIKDLECTIQSVKKDKGLLESRVRELLSEKENLEENVESLEKQVADFAGVKEAKARLEGTVLNLREQLTRCNIAGDAEQAKTVIDFFASYLKEEKSIYTGFREQFVGTGQFFATGNTAAVKNIIDKIVELRIQHMRSRLTSNSTTLTCEMLKNILENDDQCKIDLEKKRVSRAMTKEINEELYQQLVNFIVTGSKDGKVSIATSEDDINKGI